MSVSCRVRIYLPVDSSGNYLKGETKAHYNFQISGTNKVNGRSFVNTVIDYDPVGIRLYNDSVMASVHTERFKLYTLDFTSSSSISTFWNKLSGYLASTPTEHTLGHIYTVTSGLFVTYSVAHQNCFAATAVFADWMGYSTCLDIYNANNSTSTSYKNYYAWRMYEKHRTAWTYRGLYNA